MTHAARARWLVPAYIVVAPTLGALLAWPTWRALVAVGIVPDFESLTLRMMELCALGLLLPVLKRTGGCDRAAWGYALPGRTAWRAFGIGMLLGMAMLSIPALLLIGFGARDFRAIDLGFLVVVLAKGLISGVAVALLEETWFRGGLVTAMARGFGWTAAVIGSAVIYMLVHFLNPEPVASVDMGPLAGLGVALDAFGGLHIDDRGAALTLLLAGLLLGLLRARSGHIALCIGLHAGWVVVIASVRRVTRFNHTDPQSVLAGGYDGVIGWLAAAVFAAALLTVLALQRQQRET